MEEKGKKGEWLINCAQKRKYAKKKEKMYKHGDM